MGKTAAFNNSAVASAYPEEVVKRFLKTVRENTNDALLAMIEQHGAGIVHVVDENGQGAIAHAVATGRRTHIQTLMRFGGDINAKDKNGVTGLMSASKRGFTSMVAFLLDTGAALEAKDNSGWTPLMYAAYHVTGGRNPVPLMSKRKLDTVQLLLDRNASIDATDKDGWTVIRQAEGRKNRDALALITAAVEKRRLEKEDYDRRLKEAFGQFRSGTSAVQDAPVRASFRKPGEPHLPKPQHP